MKTTLFSGLKTRAQVLALTALCAFSMTGTAFAAQDAAAPASVDAPVVEAVAEAAAEVVAAPEEAVAVEAAAVEEAETGFDHGDVAWMLTATLLVLLMTVPGLALFYGGLVRAKNVLSVLSQVLVVFSLIVVLWAVYGYSAVFTESNAFFGNFAEKAFLKGITPDTISGGLPELLFVAFQSTFAGITTALIVGSFAERIKFGAVILFSVLWFTFSYIPMAHIVWGGGYLAELGAIDFAGGTVVHINAGVAGLVGAYFLGKRKGYGQNALKPHNVPYVFIGASLLWVGWFGFNAGSAAAANETASLAFINTILATSAAVVAWTLVETLSKGKPSALGSASGAVAGLVGITPACGTVGPLGAIVIGLAAGAICVWGVTGLKKLLGADDTADVFGVHGVGGIVGAILTGVFTAPTLGGTGDADFSIGKQVWIQIVSVGFTIVWCAVVTAVILLLVKTFVGLRVTEEQERDGLDITSHGESAYEA